MAIRTLKASPPRPALPVVSAPPPADAAGRRALIAQSAYLRAERRGFEPGHELNDWCAAEREVDHQLQPVCPDRLLPAVDLLVGEHR